MKNDEIMYIFKKKGSWKWLLPNFTNSLTLYHNVAIKIVQYQRNGPQQMNLAQKNIILFVILTILASGIPALTLCSTHCVTSHPGLDFHKEVKCPFSQHSFFQSGTALSIFYIIPLVGFFLVMNRRFIPAGFFPIPFRPPRFLS
jgi:hypothetical protein